MAARSLWRVNTKLLLTATVGGGAALGAAAIAKSEDPASALKLSTTVPQRLLRDAFTAANIAFGIQFSTITTSKIFTKKACIDLLKNCKSMRHFKEIQAQIFIHGLHPNIDILHKLISFSSATNLAYAEKLFTQIEIPTLFIYNVMIRACAKVGNCRKAIYLFDELRVHGLLPDNYTYPFVFKALGWLRVVPDGEKIHGFVMKTGDVYDSYVCNSVLDMYGELGRVEGLSKVFDEMPHKDLISWNILIDGFVKNNKLEKAIDVYRRMRLDRSVKPDEATIVSTLSACTSLKRLDIGREIHDYVRGQLGLTVTIGNALLDMYAKCGCLHMARGIFDTMHEKNVVCWTSMVSAYVKCGRLDEATSLFERAPVRDLILWTTMINGYIQFNKVDEAMSLFRNMQMDRVNPDKYTLVALLTGCAQSGALEQGEWIHSYIEQNGIKIDVIVGTALIEMYAKCGILDMSLKIFCRMNQKDTASWTAVICAFAMNGSTNRALQLFSEMIQVGIKPDDITFIGVLNACSHGGLVEEGRRYFDSMTEVYQIEPKLEHYGCLIDLFGRAGLLEEAEDVINKVSTKDNKLIVPLCGALLSACRNYENVDMGERMTQRILGIESRDSSNYMLLAHIYASASRWDDVTKVRRKMTTIGLKKTQVPFRASRHSSTLFSVSSISTDYEYSLWGLAEDSVERAKIKREVHARSALKLQELCFRNGGIYIKLGQHISQLEYLVPDEYVQIMRQSMLNRCPVSSYEQVCDVVKKELGGTPDEIFDDFDPVPIASASLAQVHVARTHDGHKVAVKVQHTHMLDTAAADYATVELIVNTLHWLFPSFDYRWLTDEMRESIPKELDFLIEAKNSEKCMDNFRRLSPHISAYVYAPEVFWNLSTSKLLVMEFIDGAQVNDLRTIQKLGIGPSDVSKLLSHTFAEMMFKHGFVHCDPHAANVLVRPLPSGNRCIFGRKKPQLVLLDHGLYKDLDFSTRINYASLWKGLVFSDANAIKENSAKLGAGEDLYALFAGILTLKPWNKVVDPAVDHLVVQGTESDHSELQMYASQYFAQITELLRRLPREILLMLKTNECLRAVNRSLMQGSSLETFLIVGRISSEAVIESKLLQNRSFLTRICVWFEEFMLDARLFTMQIALWLLKLQKALTF